MSMKMCVCKICVKYKPAYGPSPQNRFSLSACALFAEQPDSGLVVAGSSALSLCCIAAGVAFLLGSFGNASDSQSLNEHVYTRIEKQSSHELKKYLYGPVEGRRHLI